MLAMFPMMPLSNLKRIARTLLFAVHPLHLHRRPSRLGEACRWRELWGEWGHGVAWTKACEPHKSQSRFGKKIPKRILESKRTKQHSNMYGKLGWQCMFNHDDMWYGKFMSHPAAKIHDLVLGHPKKCSNHLSPGECGHFQLPVFPLLRQHVSTPLHPGEVSWLKGIWGTIWPSDDQFWRQKMWEGTIFFSEIDRSFNWIFEKILWETSGLRKLLGISFLHILRVTYSLYVLKKKRSFVAEGRLYSIL